MVKKEETRIRAALRGSLPDSIAPTLEKELFEEPDPENAFLIRALANYEEAVARIVTAREIIPQNFPDTERTPWLNQTGWLEHLKGRNSRVLSNATKLPGASKVGLQKLCTIAKELVSSLNRTAFGYRPGTL